MKKLKIYLDTSVISMLDDSERGIITRDFFEFAIQRGYQFVVSEVVRAEIDDTPEENKRVAILQFLETLSCVSIPYNQESIDLAWTYVSEEILTTSHIDDLTHIAYATVFGCNMIVSWNRKHIAKPIKTQKINACNLKNNYSMIAIYTPQEFLTLYQ
ncbi:MAG: hypothetical protein LBC02_10915 [Planctomycetaceae bacterium]|jgi:hypothetical protein|nr:hypothetical protein [Planctomycetaceae bacterium]